MAGYRRLVENDGEAETHAGCVVCDGGEMDLLEAERKILESIESLAEIVTHRFHFTIGFLNFATIAFSLTIS